MFRKYRQQHSIFTKHCLILKQSHHQEPVKHIMCSLQYITSVVPTGVIKCTNFFQNANMVIGVFIIEKFDGWLNYMFVVLKYGTKVGRVNANHSGSLSVVVDIKFYLFVAHTLRPLLSAWWEGH